MNAIARLATTVAYTPPYTPQRLYGLARAPGLRAAVGGRRVLVTGASSGIGRATAAVLARAGATVLLVARDAEALAGLVAELEEEGHAAHALPCDLADPDAVDALVARVLEEHGGVDVLVNNAGLSIRRSVVRSADRPQDYERTMQVNYFGAMRLTRGLLPAMLEQRSGHVVNASTMGLQAGAPRFGAYLASKAALDAFGRCLAQETRHAGVRVTTINLPLVRTPMIAPTDAYANALALSVPQAVGLVVEAIRTRPTRLVPRLGVAMEIGRALSPRGVEAGMNLAFLASRARAAEARGEDVRRALPGRVVGKLGFRL